MSDLFSMVEILCIVLQLILASDLLHLLPLLFLSFSIVFKLQHSLVSSLQFARLFLFSLLARQLHLLLQLFLLFSLVSYLFLELCDFKILELMVLLDILLSLLYLLEILLLLLLQEIYSRHYLLLIFLGLLQV